MCRGRAPGASLRLPHPRAMIKTAHLNGDQRRMRPSKRASDELRKVSLERGVARYAEGSCLVAFGDTRVLCTASLEERGRHLAARQRQGLGDGRIRHAAARHPRAHAPRGDVGQAVGADAGDPAPDRPQPPRRLQPAGDRRAPDHRRLRRDPGRRRHPHRRDHRRLGRAARLLPLDAGALHHLGQSLARARGGDLLRHSCRHAGARPRLCRGSAAETDANFVITGSGGLVEVQGTAEGKPFSEDEFLALLRLAKGGVTRLVELQKLAVA